MDAAEVGVPADDDEPRRAGYRRSAGSPRGEARRRELLRRVCDDLAVNGLVDFSLRRAARAAGTTHKVLLYYFDGPEDLMRQAILQLRERRIGAALAAATQGPPRRTLDCSRRAGWPRWRTATRSSRWTSRPGSPNSSGSSPQGRSDPAAARPRRPSRPA